MARHHGWWWTQVGTRFWGGNSMTYRYFLWDNGRVEDLGQLAAAFGDFVGLTYRPPMLNDLGQIALSASTGTGGIVPLVLTPVPEIAMLLAGLGLRRRGLSPRTGHPGLPQPSCAAA